LEIDNLKVEISNRKKSYEIKNDTILKMYENKKNYEEGRNDAIQSNIVETVATHK
jgi:hypothetical protein